MARIGIGVMFTDDLVVGCKERAEWKLLDVRFSLRANDNLVEETDI